MAADARKRVKQRSKLTMTALTASSRRTSFSGWTSSYLQAKRWTNTVHRPEIDKFIGALTRQRARKGVFITTSDFSDGARNAAMSLDIKVVLIDGPELARLMVENNLGCSVRQVYEVRQLDSDYFVEY